jgi:arylsulfatase A-like enzyme
LSTVRNVIFILADQLNARFLRHAGHPQVLTPHLDRLAAEGVRFSDAVCSNPICTPSRVSFLSGQYCHNHLYYGLFGPNPAGLPSILGHCRERGFHTAAIGKIHCPDGWIENHSVVFHETCNSSVGGRSPSYLAFLGSRQMLEDNLLLPEFGDQGRQSMDARPSPLTFAESQEGWIAAETIRQIDRARSEGKPFAIHTSLPRPHQCTSPSREFWELYDRVDLGFPPTADDDASAAGKSPHLIEMARFWRQAPWPLLEPRTFMAARERKLRGYLAAISQVDAAVGLILDHLRASGLDRDTLVIFSADHGEYATAFGIMEKAPGICADAVTRIPLIMRCAGMPAGRTVSELVHAADVAPTICALLGLDALATADGQDLSALLRGDAGAKSRHSVTVTEFAWSKAVRKGRWRLVWYPVAFFAREHPGGFGELYDLVADPWERHNRWQDGDCRDVKAELERELLNWLVTTTRPRTTMGASVHPSLLPGATQQFRCLVQADGKIPAQNLLTTANPSYL